MTQFRKRYVLVSRSMGGRTRSYGCDGILCPLGYYHAEGFANDSNDSCTKCPNGKTTIYLGSVECVELHVEDLLSMLHDVMGGELWDKNEVLRWNTEVNVCHWSGVICEDDGTLVSVSFPLTRITDPLGDAVVSDVTLNRNPYRLSTNFLSCPRVSTSTCQNQKPITFVMADYTKQLLAFGKKMQRLSNQAKKMKKFSRLFQKVTVGCLKKDKGQGTKDDAAS
ncbi:hypothetical protein MHU86_3498 [Fragilaria crotonensis]|nr:hypothetical protein MHU86_3498 [Fragilaria crotonensis]